MNKKIKLGIVGGTGYTAGELIRILQFHPKIEKINIISKSHPEKRVSSIHDDLLNYDGTFTEELEGNEDLIFLCLGHGITKQFLSKNKISKLTKIIDLSSDFRLKLNNKLVEKKFIYGLPELNKNKIQFSNYLANPGCFATAIQLALLPLVKNNLIKNEIHICGITGSSGAGKALSNFTNFTWRNNNISTYKEFNHQHILEIKENLTQLQKNLIKYHIRFIPYRGNFTRGIFASIYTKFYKSINEANEIFEEYYKNDPFIKISKQSIHLKQVIGTNFCYLHLIRYEDEILINSIIDNLVKGASGQAIQNMNLMFGWKETLGLEFKGIYF